MQNVVVDRPYTFVPPHSGRWWPWALQRLLPRRLLVKYGITSVSCAGTEHLKASLRSGDGAMLAPNHCRPSDPEVVHEMSRQIRELPYMMASWHLFMESRFQAYLLRRGGVFSIYREGTDRASLNMAIRLLEAGGRPIVVFPEGVMTRANDRLNPLLEGPAFIARGAARKREKSRKGGRIVIHPVAIRYRYAGDVCEAVEPVLSEIESRLTWRPQRDLPLEDRITKLGGALLSLKEIEYLGAPQDGTIAERAENLIDALLTPLEREWLQGARERHVVARVKVLRSAVLRDMLHAELPEPERVRRWRQMEEMYLAQSISFYPPDYLAAHPTSERMLETVEHFEEDLTDTARKHEPLEAAITVGEPIIVSPERKVGGGEDPLLIELEQQLTALLEVRT